MAWKVQVPAIASYFPSVKSIAMTKPVFEKTAKGREEIATRKYRLASRLRTLLLLIDGKHGSDDLLQKVAGIGLTESGFDELLDQGFIYATPAGAADGSAQTVSDQPVAAVETTPEESMQPADTAGSKPVLPNGESQFEAVYRFYTATIRSTMGLRGYTLQIKVEKAGSLDDFKQLRRPYLEAVLKAKGDEMARSLRGRLDELLYYGEAAPPSNTLLDSALTPQA
jgi:hypothetical protein